MAKNAFIDNNHKYVKAFSTRNYEALAEEIISDRDDYSYVIEKNDAFAAYKIAKNEPVSALYGFDCYVVRFFFVGFTNLHSDFQEQMCDEMLEKLKADLAEKKGYYNFRLPTHMVDLIRAFNKKFTSTIMCGGTVEEYILNKNVEVSNPNNLKIFEADMEYINKHKDRLMDMTYKSFESYQGQYHLSDVTSFQAGKIYENWIEKSMGEDFGKDQVIIAEFKDEPVGFVTICEDDNAVDGILSAVSSEKRQLGAYKLMIAYIINYANDHGKAFITSTQFDNYIVQGVWNSLGLKPFYSIYNIHVDNR